MREVAVEPGAAHDPCDDPVTDNGLSYRVLRFFDTFKGFHKVGLWAISSLCTDIPAESQGELDLAGRHQRRYDSISRRLPAFIEGFTEIMQHSSVSREPVLDSNGQPLMVDNEPVFSTILQVNRPDLLDQFEEKWKLRINDPNVFVELISAHPSPKIH